MDESLAWCTLLVIAITCVVSYRAFMRPDIVRRFLFDPQEILAEKEYYRIVTSGFLHADGRHLFFNMLTLFLFGSAIERVFGKGQFLAIYFGAVIGGSLLSLLVHRHHQYRALGASGGTCGLIFAYILLFRGANIYAYFVPIPVPGWLYAIGYILYSFYGLKENRGNIGHDAHLGGAIIGFLITAAMVPDAVRYNPKIFALVLGVAVPLLVYLWLNPLWLPLGTFMAQPKQWNWPWRSNARSRRHSTTMPKHRREALDVDAILEKISKKGFESLSEEEKAFMSEVSGKYKRRAESKKPDSGLAI